MIEKIIHKEIAQECDRTPDEKLSTIVDRIKERFSHVGPDHMRQFKESLELGKLNPIFPHELIPNPTYWIKSLNREFCFYLIESKASRYKNLLALLEKITGFTHSICYGQYDVILRVVASEEVQSKVKNLLEDNGYPTIQLRLNNIPPYFLGKKTNDSIVSLKYPDIDPEQIDVALIDSVDNIDPDLLSQLDSSGIIIGKFYNEKEKLTGRIRCYVAIDTERALETHIQNELESKLIALNYIENVNEGKPSLPVVSIFRCSTTG